MEPLAGLPEATEVDAWPLDAGQLERTDEMLLSISSYVEPTKLALAKPDQAIETLKETPTAFDASGLAVTRHEAMSIDGERIP